MLLLPISLMLTSIEAPIHGFGPSEGSGSNLRMASIVTEPAEQLCYDTYQLQRDTVFLSDHVLVENSYTRCQSIPVNTELQATEFPKTCMSIEALGTVCLPWRLRLRKNSPFNMSRGDYPKAWRLGKSGRTHGGHGGLSTTIQLSMSCPPRRTGMESWARSRSTRRNLRNGQFDLLVRELYRLYPFSATLDTPDCGIIAPQVLEMGLSRLV